MKTKKRALVRELEKRSKKVEKELFEHVADRGQLGVVQAPPGSGKTWLLLKTATKARRKKLRVAVATQTNSQADDICRRLARDYPKIQAVRFTASGADVGSLGNSIVTLSSVDLLPSGATIVVGTSAKWGLVTITEPFDVLFVEEAWQLSWADFMLLSQVSERFVLIGDPGQIPPVVRIDTSRWATSPRPPHFAAPEVILADTGLDRELWSLPATRRLPSDTAGLVQPFYDFDFAAFALPEERTVAAAKGGRSPSDRAIDLLRSGSVGALTIPTPDSGPPMEEDIELAEEASKLIKRLFRRGATLSLNGERRKLEPSDIGLCATHRVMNTALTLALPRTLQRHVVVDTPERWQGLERPVMVIIHPLSGVVQPSAFNLQTGRLCVMASRHTNGLILLGRDHVSSTLEEYIPKAEQPLTRPDVEGRGLFDNLNLWRTLEGEGRVVVG